MKILLLFFVVLILNACTVLPEAGPEPKRLQLLPIALTAHPIPITAYLEQQLAVNRPSAAAPLRSRELWYREEQALNAFSRYQWAESLDQQLQHLLVQALGQAAWTQSVLKDQPGFASDLHLLVHIDQWYLNAPEHRLDIDLQVTLLDQHGRSLYQRHWQAHPQVEQPSPLAMVSASQAWLATWFAELEADLARQLNTI